MTTARQAILDAMSEAELQALIVSEAQQHGWLVHHDQANTPVQRADGSIHRRTVSNGDPGFPDLVMARGGTTVVVEVKRKGGRFRPGQREWLAALGARVCYPADVDGLIAFLRRPPKVPARTGTDGG